jgi:ABC-type polar amino acid transport system ATPase subunit
MMKNCEMKVKDGKLTITVDLSKTFGPSGSGKTIIVASTMGNQFVTEGGVTVGLNVYKKPETK